MGGGKKQTRKEPSVRMSKSEEEKKKERLYEIKIVLLGDPAVGKSSLVQRFCADKFEDKYKITIGGAYLQKEVKLLYELIFLSSYIVLVLSLSFTVTISNSLLDIFSMKILSPIFLNLICQGWELYIQVINVAKILSVV